MKEAQKEEEDPFASIVKLCLPTASQESELQICSLARESENFEDTISSSPDPTQTLPSPIAMVSESDSADAKAAEEEDDAVFHTPPENHLRSTSSSELNFVDTGDAFADLNKTRVSDRGLDDEAESKKVRVSEVRGVSETEAIVGESVGNESLGDTEIIELDDSDSDETVNLDVDCVEIDKIGVLPRVDGEETRKLVKYRESTEDVEVNKSQKRCESGKSDVSLATCKSEEDIVDLKCITVDECVEMRVKSVVEVSKEAVEVLKGEKTSNANEYGGGCCENSVSDESVTSSKINEEIMKLKCFLAGRCIGTRDESIVAECKEVIKVVEDGNASKDSINIGVKSVDVIDNCMSVGGSGVKRSRKLRMVRDNGVAGKRRHLPLSLEEKENNMGNSIVAEKNAVETNNGILDLLDVLKEVVGGVGNGSEDVDILETAMRQGLTFPRPRWWPE